MTGPYCSANTFRLIKSIEITMADNWSQGELKIIKETKRERKKKGKFRLKRTREVVVNQDVIGMLSVLVSGPITEPGKGNRDHHDFFQHSNENQSICKANVYTFFYLVTINK